MDVRKMKKDDLELMSNTDITYNLLENSKKGINTADLFNEIIKLLELPKNTFDNKVGDYYTTLSTDKRFIMLDDGRWDLRSRHTSDQLKQVPSIDDDDDEDMEEIKEEPDEIEEDSYDDTDDDNYSDEDDSYKDLVVIDEDELELEE